MKASGAEDVFTRIYLANSWGDEESVSGPGSSLARTENLRAELSSLLKSLAVRTILDVGCGDFNWMRSTDLAGALYIGTDVVAPLIRRNAELYGGPHHQFLQADLLSDPLPKADLILCRDCLVHLCSRDIDRAVQNMRRSGSTWLLATTFTAQEANEDIVTGNWRPLNLQLAPFHFPVPARVIRDGPRPDGTYPDKALALYGLNEIKSR